MNDLIREIQATAMDLGDALRFALYEHQEPNAVSMVRHWGLAYTLEAVTDVYESAR